MQPPALSITVSKPLWVAYQRTPQFTLTYPQGYQHAINAVGGYWSMSWRVVGNQIEVEDWLADGLGRHIEVYDDALSVCWEGFVNEVEAGIGPLSVTRGPLLDVGNRVYVTYSQLYTDFSPPANGTRAATATVNDTDSQGRWGIQIKNVAGGSQTQLTAEYIRDAWIAENAEPQTSQQYGGGNEVGATIRCLGYWHLLNYPYNQVITAGTVDLSDDDGTGKMQYILAANPNGIFSADYTNMDDNAIQVPYWENTDQLAGVLLKRLADVGDTSNNRCIVGVYAGRKCHYGAIPTDTAYYQYLLDPQQKITTPLGAEVKPWNVLPGRWLFYPDRNIGRTVPSSRRLDDRFEFIEQVTYNSEGSPPVLHVGGKVDRLPQILARMNLGEG